MSERRFMLYEVEPFREDAVYKQYAITLSELKRRLAVICNRSGPSDAIRLEAEDIHDEDIETLVNGEEMGRRRL
jgi:hypothetical protein